jgi:NADPH:quinone reductase-like Zn-dependent oxidoreductase
LQALESGNLKPGARVLVHGGAGGVGHMVVQLAKVHFKAYVVATAGPANQTYIKEVCHSPSSPRRYKKKQNQGTRYSANIVSGRITLRALQIPSLCSI